MKLVAALVVATLIAACGGGGAEPTGPSPVAVSPSLDPSATPSQPGAQTPAVALAVSDGVARAAVDPDAPVAALVAGWNDAGFDLLRRLPADDNVVFSPASIGHALLMAAAAADEGTRTGIERVFGLPAGAHDAWNSIDQAIAATASDQVTVTLADRIWPSTAVEPDQEWIDLLASHHGADVVPLAFATDTEASRRTINDWVADRTGDLIPDLLSEGDITADTVLVLTDAVHFAADWALPFGKYDPVPGTFTTLDGTGRDVSLMQELELQDRRGTGDGFVGAEIPYAGDDYSMLILVPDIGRYQEVIDRLDQDLLDEIDSTFTTGPYELLMPKWDHTYRIDLSEWLTDLGVAPGSFPAVSPAVSLGTAVHAADITVDEQGTVAAAATALGFPVSGPPEPELTVAADRPFVYLIRHRPSGLVLFAGHVADPT